MAHGKNLHPDLLEDDVKKLYRKYLIPSISATLVTSIYILADTMMIGRGVGPVGIAALNLLLPLFSLFFGTGMLFGVGGGVLLSVSKGRGQERRAKEYFTAACICAAVVSALYVAGFHLFFDPITRALGRNDSMDAYVREYGRALVTGAPVFLFSALFQAFVRNDKAPKLAMAAVVTGGISNVILDYLFIFPMGMGMAGAAIASVIGSALTVLILTIHLFSRENTLKWVGGVRPAHVREIAANGFSSFLLEMSNGVVVFLFNLQLLRFVGDIGVVVYGIISNSALIAASVCNGIAQAAQPLLATNYGAGRGQRVLETRRLGALAAGIAGVLFAAAGFLFPALVTEAFIKPSGELLALSVPAIRIYFLSFLMMGLNLLYGTYFQSVMKPGYAMLICLARGLVLNGGLVFLLPPLLGVTGIWLTMPVTEGLTLALCVVLMRRKVRLPGPQ